MKATRTVNWISSSGSRMEAVIVATCKLSDNISYSDGWNVNLGKEIYESLEISLTMDGKFVEKTSQEPSVIDGPVFSSEMWTKAKASGGYAIVGRKVLLKENIYAEIMSAIEGVKQEVNQPEEIRELKTEEAKKEAAKKIRDSEREEQHKRELKNGLCPKCGTYCYGDCESN